MIRVFGVDHFRECWDDWRSNIVLMMSLTLAFVGAAFGACGPAPTPSSPVSPSTAQTEPNAVAAHGDAEVTPPVAPTTVETRRSPTSAGRRPALDRIRSDGRDLLGIGLDGGCGRAVPFGVFPANTKPPLSGRDALQVEEGPVGRVSAPTPARR